MKTAPIIVKATWVALMGAFLISLFTGNWGIAAIAAFTFVLTLLPYYAENRLNIYIPQELVVVNTLFMYATVYLGYATLYEALWWWDPLIHFFSGILLGLISYIILIILVHNERVAARPLLISIFAVAFALAAGALWEIIEYIIDIVFGTNMLESGIPDTMGDLILDMVGATIASTAGYFYLKRGRESLFGELIHKTVKKNSDEGDLSYPSP